MLILIYSNTTKCIEKYEKVARIFLDFAQTLDTVNRKFLVHELDYYDTRGLALYWFKCLLLRQDSSSQILKQFHVVFLKEMF